MMTITKETYGKKHKLRQIPILWTVILVFVMLLMLIGLAAMGMGLFPPDGNPVFLTFWIIGLLSALVILILIWAAVILRSYLGWEKERLHSSRNYRSLMDHMAEGYALLRPVLDENGNLQGIYIREMNASLAEQWGVQAGEWLAEELNRRQNIQILSRVLHNGHSYKLNLYSQQLNLLSAAEVFRTWEGELGLITAAPGGIPAGDPKLLERQVDERTKELQTANDELETFNYTISHEIKAPVRAIDGYARIFMEDYGSRLDGEGLAMIQNIRHICKDTITLINKLLEYTTIAREEPDKEIVDLAKMITGVFDELIGAGEYGKARLYVDEEIPSVIGDSILLKQAITNMISNALKFTRGKETPVIHVGYKNREDEDLFYVQDNGAGFDVKFSHKLFGMFQRVHTDDEFEGTGIGLSIVKKVIQKHGGRVWIEGEVGKGATIYFTLKGENVLR